MGLFIGSSRLLERLRFIRDAVNDIQSKITSTDFQQFNNLQNRIQKIEYDLQDIKIILQKINQQSNHEPPNSWDYIRLKKLHQLLSIKDVNNVDFVRIGRDYDGGYIMLNDFNKNMVAYSYGISNDVSWDLDMAKRNIHCYMYDHTISSLPEESSFFHWTKEGICGVQKIENCNSLDIHIKNNNHTSNKNLILKMDVEGAEWNSILGTNENTLSQFKQMVFEFHDMYDPRYFNTICKAIEKLNQTHQCIHVHGNNYGPRKCANTLVMPHALEVLYVRKDDYTFSECNHFYPRAFDMPCNPFDDEIILGYWNVQ